MPNLENAILYSSNGQTWNNSIGSNFGNGGYVNSVAYDGIGKWVSVGSGNSTGNNINYSTDGINWKAVNGPFDKNGKAYFVSYSGGKWIAVGKDPSGNNIYYSTNGINWNAVTGSPFTANGIGYAVAYDGMGKWVAVGDGNSSGNNIYYSTDGMIWNPVNGPFTISGIAYSVAYGGNKWVAVGNSGTLFSIYHSDDGIVWNPVNGGFDSIGYSVAFNGTIWVAVGKDSFSRNIFYSSNAVSWNGVTSPFATGKGLSVTHGGGNWVAVGEDDSGSGNNIYYSTDGQSWTAATGNPFGTSGSGNSVAYDGSGKWVAVGYDSSGSGNNIYYSTDSSTWFASQGSPFGNTEALNVAYGGGKWIAVGNEPFIKPTPSNNKYIDLSKFLLPTCPSTLKVDKIDGKVLSASIQNFKENTYYAFYIDGNKVVDNIQTEFFEYKFSFPGRYNIYITCSIKPTNNAAQTTLPNNIISVYII